MRRILLVFGFLVVIFGFSSCQCSNKPEMAPVEGASVAHVGAAPAVA